MITGAETFGWISRSLWTSSLKGSSLLAFFMGGLLWSGSLRILLTVFQSRCRVVAIL